MPHLHMSVLSVKGTADSIRKILKLLRLTKPNTAVFVPATPSTLQMLKRVEPYIAYGFPTLKTVRDLVYKHGQGRVGDKAVTLTDNALIEKELGEHNVICIEDIVHEIATVGESFRAVNRFLQPFKLKRPTERWKNERKKFVEDDELGFSAEKINEVIERMS
ncbi:hypothetical protein PTSG_09667 [Salpingoeca rosetta]|uniref:Large ribosomal subunit protein uL30-like ferredoxin-like fold domain-containing protein n=1 Tax=Salpingoeca rosetta (strain ATCC 50818 / BSB-021) TaxID=946362 RepID=F2ULN1_SALR5|nr:uncharacterized protein PTSG_09667 [Salpingoeca rosetta]EGD78030.1 hypothetical protein PTSG_09667 [Salpingoeca rosetta]|eukprot:XP_004990092.1 hypothetical protein PTSG_09667 [Salpingoeca rosetta]